MSAGAASPVLEVGVPVATVWTSPDAPRDVDAPAVADVPDMAAWTGAMDAEARLGLHGRTLTQALLGEAVRVVEERGDWVRVLCLGQRSSADPDGYPGWVRRSHLAEPVLHTGRTVAVTSRSATCRLDDGQVELSFGTELFTDETGPHGVRASEPVEGEIDVLLPGRGRGRVARSAVHVPESPGPSGPSGDELVRTAARFLGLRYLWGGTSAWGLDCSGLVHLVLRSHGVHVPRDAFDQAEGDHLQPVPLDDVRPGDLYFFARPGERIYHVGFASRALGEDGTRWMLHAPEGGELVEDAPLAPHRRDTLVSAGRVRAPGRG